MEYNKISRDKSEEGIVNAISFALMIVVMYLMNTFTDTNNLVVGNTFYTLLGIVLGILGFFRVENIYVLKKEIQIGKGYTYFWPIIIALVGGIELIVQYITRGTMHGSHHIINSVVVIPMCVLILNKYLYNINYNTEILDNVCSKISFSKVKISVLVSGSYLFLHWFSYERTNFSIYSLLVNILHNWIIIIILLLQCIYVYQGLSYAKNNSMNNIKFEIYFPYGFAALCAVAIIIWGSYAFTMENYVLETSFYATVLVYILAYLIFASIIHFGIKSKMSRKDRLLMKVIVCGLIGYTMLVNNAANLKGAVAGNAIGILSASLVLLSFIYFVFNSNQDENGNC